MNYLTLENFKYLNKNLGIYFFVRNKVLMYFRRKVNYLLADDYLLMYCAKRPCQINKYFVQIKVQMKLNFPT